MSLTLAANALIAFAPSLKKWLGFGDDSIASKAIDVATTLTVTKNVNDAVEKLAGNPTLCDAFELQIQQEQVTFEALLADRVNARANYANSHKVADSIASRVMEQNLPLAIVVIIIQCLITYFLREQPALLATATMGCTLILKHLIDERKDVTGFYFGGALKRDEPKQQTDFLNLPK